MLIRKLKWNFKIKILIEKKKLIIIVQKDIIY